MTGPRQNWARNLTFGASELTSPSSEGEVRDALVGRGPVKVLGTGHAFTAIADTPGLHLSLHRMNRIGPVDPDRRQVTIEAGVRYGDLSPVLHTQGWALPNLASLPHINVAGACATGTHGSGLRNGGLATALASFDLLTAAGQTVRFLPDDPLWPLAGGAVHLGALGVVLRLTLNLEPAFDVRQRVFDGLDFDQALGHLDEVLGASYSVSLFTTWQGPVRFQVWTKARTDRDDDPTDTLRARGAMPADSPRHPVPGVDPSACTEQLGRPGPWFERLPHFRLDFTPSQGDEIQTEYLVPRRHAAAALGAVAGLRQRVAPLLHVSEIRSVAADGFWLSPSGGEDALALHFTWKSRPAEVHALLPDLEQALAPLGARPHWGKVFRTRPGGLRGLYPELGAFEALRDRCDPERRFDNTYLRSQVFGTS